jgi:RNA recognition motif-containing protein
LEIEEFRGYFEKYGELEDCVILQDKKTSKPRGFGFVTYFNVDCADRVMENKDQH